MSNYTGIANLEALEQATNYNRFLVGRICDAAGGAGACVDFGAGTGTLARGVAARGITVTCIEPDPTLRRRLAAAGLPVLADAEELAPGSTDYIYSVNVLEHIEGDAAVLGCLRSKLRRGGRLFVYVPAFQRLWTNMDRRVGHVRRYEHAELGRLLVDSGFAVERLRYADSLGFFATLLYRWVGSRDGNVSPRGVRLYDRVLFPASRLVDRLGFDRVLGKNLMALARRST